MKNYSALSGKTAAFAAVVLSASLLGLAPAVAANVPAKPPLGPNEFPIAGQPFVGSELSVGQITNGIGDCGRQDEDPDYVVEWLSNGTPLPTERQGKTLTLVPADRGNRIAFNVQATCNDSVAHSAETLPIADSNRAMGWTGRGNFELLGRTSDGDLVLYPRTYESSWTYGGPGVRVQRFTGSWDEPRVVGTGWDMFDIVFSPGDFDGDGFNDVLARDSAGRLFLYPGDGGGGWEARRQVGTGWGIFDTIVGAGDFNGDLTNDVLARDSAGRLFLYPGDGTGGWLAPRQVGTGWGMFNKIVAAGSIGDDGAVGIFARAHDGTLHQYPADGQGGWKPPSAVGPGWNDMAEISSAGPYGKSPFSVYSGGTSLIAYNRDGDLFSYSIGGLTAPYFVAQEGQIGTGWNIFESLI
ncbi:VCBS repeat-containing protein [Paenarthrobacter ilicis]|uniref:FG-GAP repeat domain-containing protein n=1 Tax=Paenarthrobacter ilicis TaxID=43665 RepID=UPI00300A9F71